MESKKYSHLDVYKLIFETSTEGILVCNKKGEIKLANSSMLSLFGYEREELINQKIEFLLPDSLKKLHVTHRDGYSKAPEKKQMGAGRDLFGLKKNGDKLPLEISLNHMTIEDDFFVMALVTDISERKKQEEKIHELNADLEVKVQQRTKELKENQVLYGLIAENFPNGIIGVLDSKLEFTFAAGEELKKSGLVGKFLVGKSYLDSFDNSNREEVLTKLKRVFKGDVCSFEIKKRNNIYQVDAVPLVYPDAENISQILVVEHNVTKVKNIEEKMRDSLEREKELGEMKSQFISMASHEFRTPLSTILSSVSLIEKYDVLGNKEKKKVHFQKVKNNIRSLTNMLNDTLTISQIEERTNDLDANFFDLYDLAQEALEESEGLIKANQKIEVNFTGTKIIKTDRQILKTVLVNLLSNAIKYSEENIIMNIDSTYDVILVKIVDKGIGIPLNDQKHLFERFYRANNAENIQGTGLGLNIVNSYISILKGEIKIESKENIGTQVEIKIPVIE